MAKIPVSGPFS